MWLFAQLPPPVARIALRAAFRAARVWWAIRRPDQHGALVALHQGDTVLLLRQSYQPRWTFPGGGVRAREAARAAAARELAEEIGLQVRADELAAAATVTHDYLARRDRVDFFALRPETRPTIRLDEREIVEARWLTIAEAMQLDLVPHVRDYLRGLQA